MDKQIDSRIKENERTECLSCGREVSKKWNYCPKCGVKLKEASLGEV